MPSPESVVGEDRQAIYNRWVAGMQGPGTFIIDDGHDHRLHGGANGRVFTTSYPISKPSVQDESESYQDRLALALRINRVCRVLTFDRKHNGSLSTTEYASRHPNQSSALRWNGYTWENTRCSVQTTRSSSRRLLPASPFKVLDAPDLRDDFYCSILAYCATCKTLAVGLGNLVYTWSEGIGARMLHGIFMDRV
ncbi:hypothetical protein B0I35DRAFT_478564 [Stachybotrys elegans]|uniref:Uncharacterized protein n=1 Tax=Stachybotrys elegans TaxID=80388 RepID=A0A8K0STD9_9HYPO|nr:hypothetical protein B0I35DRAFT_478564 [Stachybotrys elegans]